MIFYSKKQTNIFNMGTCRRIIMNFIPLTNDICKGRIIYGSKIITLRSSEWHISSKTVNKCNCFLIYTLKK